MTRRATWLTAGLVIALPTVMVLGIASGAVGIAPGRVLAVVADQLVPWWSDPSPVELETYIIWDLRAPRVMTAALVGAALAGVGAVLQAVVRNPLADPYLLGISSGAGTGAVLSIVLGVSALGGLTRSVAAFAGAIIATLAVLILGRREGRVEPVRLILAGVALSFLFSGLTSFLTLTTQAEEVFSVLFWLLGTVAAADWMDVGLLAPVVGVGIAAIFFRSGLLNALLAGDETAIGVGVSVHRLRTELLLVTSLLTGVAVAIAGGVGFVGLVVPHLVRILVGAEHRRLIPLVFLAGAVFLVTVDLAARTVVAPRELPLGVITSVLGAPFFLWVMHHGDRRSPTGVS